MIRYKVVTKDDYSLCIRKPMLRLKYLKGTVVTAKEGTPGVLVFETKKNAQSFKSNVGVRFSKIKKVRAIGRAQKLGYRLNTHYINSTLRTFKSFLNHLKGYSGCCYIWPHGTLAYKSVEVLD